MYGIIANQMNCQKFDLENEGKGQEQRNRCHSTRNIRFHFWLSVGHSERNVYAKKVTLGVSLDSTLSFEDHINGIIRSWNYHIRALRHIRRHLTREMANTVACSIVGTRIDYCNSLLYGVSEKFFDKLQHVQNKLARVVMNVGLRHHHTVDLLRELHWLPVRSRIIFKISTLCHRVLQDSQPTYLAAKVDLYRPTRTLRSSDQDLLTDRRHEPRLKRAGSRVQRPKCGTPSHIQYERRHPKQLSEHNWSYFCSPTRSSPTSRKCHTRCW